MLLHIPIINIYRLYDMTTGCNQVLFLSSFPYELILHHTFVLVPIPYIHKDE